MKYAETKEEAINNHEACRTAGHAWEFKERFWLRHVKRGKRWVIFEVRRVHQCSRCTAVRLSDYQIVPGGMRLARSPKILYPDHYVLKGQKMSRAEALLLSEQLASPGVIFETE